MATLTRKSPQGAHKPFAHYSHVVTAQGANKLVFCAGQVAADPTGKVLPPDDFAAQTKMVMENLRLGASRWRRRLQRRCESDDLYLQSARCTEGARDPSGVFWRQPTGKHALRTTRPRQSKLPVGD